MARVQDIKELEERIGRAVEEYLKYPEDYTNPVLNVRLDKETKQYVAFVEDTTDGCGDVFPMAELLIDGYEPDYDKISEIANGFLFIE